MACCVKNGKSWLNVSWEIVSNNTVFLQKLIWIYGNKTKIYVRSQAENLPQVENHLPLFDLFFKFSMFKILINLYNFSENVPIYIILIINNIHRCVGLHALSKIERNTFVFESCLFLCLWKSLCPLQINWECAFCWFSCQNFESRMIWLFYDVLYVKRDWWLF